MKVAILAGGLGTRLSEETTLKPKPMVEVGEKPLLWHIMNIYAAYHYRSRNLTVKLKTGEVTMHNDKGEDWTVHLLDTGVDTNTGGRVKQVAEFIGDETFMLTYGDGVSNVKIPQLLDFHKQQQKLVTLTAVRPPARFGQMVIENDRVVQFQEKPQIGEGWINGGFFVLEPGITKYIPDDHTAWEFESLEHIAADGQLAAYQHEDFWQCMDTIRDVHNLEKLWQEGKAPWKLWN